VTGRGLLPDSALGLTEIVWVGPESEGVYIGSPSIWRLKNRRLKTDPEKDDPEKNPEKTAAAAPLVASHDFFGRSTLGSTVQVFLDPTGDGDGAGARWRYAGNVSGMYWANIFSIGDDAADDESLYLLGVSDGDHASVRHIVISKSTDLGATWTEPSILFASNSSTGGDVYHCAPTPTLVGGDGRLYRAFESSTAGEASDYSRAFVIATVEPVVVVRGAASGKKSKRSKAAAVDLLSAAAWRKLPVATFDPASMVPSSWDPRGNYFWQEGNAVEWNGTLYDVLRVDGQTNETYNKAAVLRYDSSNKSKVVFDRMIDFPSTTSKFVIRKDPASSPSSGGEFFLSIVNDVTERNRETGNVFARNHLSLAVSAPDSLYEWSVCATLLTDDTGIAGDADASAAYTGFHYVDWIFDGDDILYAVRTGYRGSNSYHNANRMTVKRIRDFRKLFDGATGRCTGPKVEEATREL
jgi:hypothetical protein